MGTGISLSQEQRKGVTGSDGSDESDVAKGATLALGATPQIDNMGNTAGPCWNFNLVRDSNMYAFNSSTVSSFPLCFAGDMWFNMASTALIGDGSMERQPTDPDLGKGEWMTEKLYKWNDYGQDGNGPFYPAAVQGDGTAAFYCFESYTPQATEYDGRTEPVILIRVYQYSATASEVKDGYLCMLYANKDLYTSFVKDKAFVINEKVKYGILGVKNIVGDSKTRLLIAYCDKTVTTPKLMALYSSYSAYDLEVHRDIYCCDAYFLYKGLIRSEAQTGYTADTLYWEAKGKGGIKGGNFDNADRLHQPFEPLSALNYDSTTMIADLDAFMPSFAVTGDGWAPAFLVGLRKLVEWELYVPVNLRGASGPNFGDINRDDAISTYLNSRCSGMDKEPVHPAGATDQICRTGFATCTKFLSNSPTGLTCQKVAKLSVPATKDIYRAICGISPDGTSIHTPPLAANVLALTTPDCACINYSQSTYKQKGMMGMDYGEFMNWLNENRLPHMLPEGRCWWPSCTDPANSLRFPDDPLPGSPASRTTPESGKVACGTVINCIAAMKDFNVDHDSIANATIIQKCGGVANTDTPPGAEDMNNGTGDYHTPSSASGPAGVMDQVKLWPKQSWFIPVVVVLGILILAAIGWFVYQNFFAGGSKGTPFPGSTVAPTVPSRTPGRQVYTQTPFVGTPGAARPL